MMDWNPEQYEEWFASEEGRFALEREAQLLYAVLADWPRRKRKLLDIGCGTGMFLERLYQMGFDVSGIDSSPAMIMASRQRLKNRADLHLGDGELLPYMDNDYDYSFLWAVLEFTDDPKAMLAEAARVAEKGVLVGFLNKHSLYHYMNVRGSCGTLSKANMFTWCEMQDLIREATGFRATMARSVLPGPMQTWRKGRIGRRLNSTLCPPFLGAFTAVRVDFVNMKPMNPLFALKCEPNPG